MLHKRICLDLSRAATLFALVALVPCSPATGEVSGADNSQGLLQITGAELCCRSRFDTGEIRIFLKNTGTGAASVRECELIRLLEAGNHQTRQIEQKINHLYIKASPPVLKVRQHGELLIKLRAPAARGCRFKCRVSDHRARLCETMVLAKPAPVTIPYVGFSHKLDRMYVYAHNQSKHRLNVGLLQVPAMEHGHNYLSINSDLEPDDKACLALEIPRPFTPGQHVNVGVWARYGGPECKTFTTVRAVNRFPILFKEGTMAPKLGMDSVMFFVNSTRPTHKYACVQTMLCPQHAHGSEKNAADKFLTTRRHLLTQNEHLLTQMWICRTRKPEAWYQFGALPDIAVINPILPHSAPQQKAENQPPRFHHFISLADHANRATQPNRYLACIDLRPIPELFVHKTFRSEELNFLVYCAIAGGAKGILYRGEVPADPFSREAFVRLNKQLQRWKPLLMIAEPVNWTSTANSGYQVRTLLAGDRALLVLVFDARYFSKHEKGKLYTPAFERRAEPVDISARLPKDFVVAQMQTVYRPLAKEHWDCQTARLNFTVQMTDSVQVYEAVLTHQQVVSGRGNSHANTKQHSK